MNTTPAFRLLKDWELPDLREWAKTNEPDLVEGRQFLTHQTPMVSYNGDIMIRRATGRARCRIDGVKIPKGELEVVFFYDMGCGSYTAAEFHVSVKTLLAEK